MMSALRLPTTLHLSLRSIIASGKNRRPPQDLGGWQRLFGSPRADAGGAKLPRLQQHETGQNQRAAEQLYRQHDIAQQQHRPDQRQYRFQRAEQSRLRRAQALDSGVEGDDRYDGAESREAEQEQPFFAATRQVQPISDGPD